MGAIVTVSQDAPDAATLDRAAAVLADGGVLVMPTDSVYGIGCAATPGNPGHRRIFRIKHRDLAQTLPWLVADESDLARYGRDVPAWMLALARAFWPGALTLVVAASDEVPPEYRRADDGTIALRMPDSNLVRELARRAGCPLATTSANTHGAPSPTSGAELEPCIVEGADLSLDAGPAPVAVASTIVGCVDGEPVVFREGAISRERVLAVCREASPADKNREVGDISVERVEFPSHDGQSTCRGMLWRPADREPAAVLQVVHGMAEHISRYDAFARALCAEGIAVAGIDHLGHGETTPDPGRRGRLDPAHGADWLIEDQHSLRLELSRLLPGVPQAIMGHSMGSFVTRCYLGRHGEGLSCAVVMGTAWQKGLGPMRAMLRVVARFRGWDYRSAFVDGLGCGGYNKAFEGTGARTGYEWLSCDEDSCRAYAADPACGFMFSLGGYMTISSLLREAQSHAAMERVPADLPVLVVSGALDPVGENGVGPATAFRELKRAGVEDVTFNLYDGARHELLNETCKDEVTGEIVGFVLDHAARR